MQMNDPGRIVDIGYITPLRGNIYPAFGQYYPKISEIDSKIPPFDTCLLILLIS
jgi:hypothetical protein